MVAQLGYRHRIATCIEELDSVGIDMNAGVNGAERVEVGEHIDQCLSQNLELRAVFHIESLVVHHEWSIHDEAQSPNHNLKILPKVLLLWDAIGISSSCFSHASARNLHQVHPEKPVSIYMIEHALCINSFIELLGTQGAQEVLFQLLCIVNS